MTLILMIIKLLSSAGFGTMFGGVMGLFNRRADLEVKKLDIEDAKNQREHELAMRDKDAEIMTREWNGRLQVAQAEGEAKTDVAAFDALAKSYDFARPAAGGKMEAFNAFVRPFVSLSYFIVTSAGSAWILYYAFMVRNITLSPEQWFDLVMYVIAWIAFMAGATIGWYYAMRPGKVAPTLGSIR
jgi:hypothetical protein